MSVDAYTPAVATGNGVTTVFPYTFEIPSGKSEVVRYDPGTFTETVLTVNVDYSVSAFDNPAGGNVTYPLSGSPLTSPYKLIIRRIVDETQEFDVSNQDAFSPQTFESALDELEFQIQQNRRSKQLRVPDGNSTTPEALVAYILAMIDAGISGGVYQPLDADLTAIAALSTSAYGRALLTVANAAAIKTLLSYVTASIDNTLPRFDGTSGNMQTSGITVSDTNDMTGIAALTMSGLLTVTGGQVKFPATQVPSADANTLDDYEEGTWTPTLTFGGGSTGLTYNTRTGSYTKIGNGVILNFELQLSAKGSSTGNVLMSGLPFTTTGSVSCMPNLGNGTFSGLTAGLVLIADAATSSMYARGPGTTGMSGLITESSFGNSSVLRGTVAHQTT